MAARATEKRAREGGPRACIEVLACAAAESGVE